MAEEALQALRWWLLNPMLASSSGIVFQRTPSCHAPPHLLPYSVCILSAVMLYRGELYPCETAERLCDVVKTGISPEIPFRTSHTVLHAA